MQRRNLVASKLKILNTRNRCKKEKNCFINYAEYIYLSWFDVPVFFYESLPSALRSIILDYIARGSPVLNYSIPLLRPGTQGDALDLSKLGT